MCLVIGSLAMIIFLCDISELALLAEHCEQMDRMYNDLFKLRCQNANYNAFYHEICQYKGPLCSLFFVAIYDLSPLSEEYWVIPLCLGSQ